MPRRGIRDSHADPVPVESLRPSSRVAHNATIERILDGAVQVLMRYGHVEFTVRRVAKAAHIAPGNLAYHFPSKRQLLRAVISRLVKEYSEELEAFLLHAEIPLEQEMESLVRWFLTHAIAVETMRTFREIWAMALHDAVIRRAVDDFYDAVMERSASALQRACPTASVTHIREFVQLLELLTEGAAVLYGTRRNRAVSYERIIALAAGLSRLAAADLRSEVLPPVRG
jgi:AcrR family transcriptional regulator